MAPRRAALRLVEELAALRQAEVGIAVGGAGTEAAREASTLVLTGDDFASIVAAGSEGRRRGASVRSFEIAKWIVRARTAVRLAV